jgi:hypothetical protein
MSATVNVTTLTFDPVTDMKENEVVRIPLTEDGTSWIELEWIPSELSNFASECFKELFDLHPKDQGKIIMYDKELLSYRWHQSYLHTPARDPVYKHSYMFAGFDESTIHTPLPEPYQRFYDFMSQRDSRFNQVVANWYLDVSDYIAQHSDCELGMIPDAVVSMMNFNKLNETENCRIFRIIPKPVDVQDALYSEVQIILRHGLMLTMGGEVQKKFKHGVPRVLGKGKEATPRFSLSFRQFAIDHHQEEMGKGQTIEELTEYFGRKRRKIGLGVVGSNEEKKDNNSPCFVEVENPFPI